jgi:hypothetical protein
LPPGSKAKIDEWENLVIQVGTGAPGRLARDKR